MSTTNRLRLALPLAAIAEVCRKYSIKRLAVFGSALRDDFGDESDVDLLAEFDPPSHPTLLTLARVEDELSALIGRRTDVHTPRALHRLIRDSVVADAHEIYAAP